MELLAPAGNLEKLKWSIIYGADAVYFGTEFGSLRSFAGNFTFDDAQAGIDYLHKRGKKGYVTLNIYPFSEEFERLSEVALTLDEMGIDAFIISDMGLLMELKRMNLRAGLFISTQANTTNYQAALAYHELGASRVILARELSMQRIREIAEKTKGIIETEVFIHGAVCFSYSGRCAISDYLTGYRANRGECKHPCRWKYFLMEETRPGEYMPVFEDERGMYLLNSRDTALFEFLPELMDAGITSVKIEGRMKSIHYLATIVSYYRQVLDGKKFTREQSLEMLCRAPNRGLSTGFMKGYTDKEDYQLEESRSCSESIFVGNITEERCEGKRVLEVRNKIFAGEELEVLNTDGSITGIKMPIPLVTRNGQQLDEVNHSQFILIDEELMPCTILRRVKKLPVFKDIAHSRGKFKPCKGL
ncbi:MAG: U32 family peptidase [Deltaproteobacteria bacterium]|jgi:putative protease|nr:U32 family peptidase [Deltaproteobacteria bacterium]